MKFFCLISFILLQLAVFAKAPQKAHTISNKSTDRLTKLEVLTDSLQKELDYLKVEREYNQIITDNIKTTYITIFSLLTFFLGLGSFSYFTKQTRKINKLLSEHKKQKEFLNSLIQSLQSQQKDSDYTYANVCNILGGLEINAPYYNFNKSFYYYMRTVKYLLRVGDKFEGIQSNLNNARSALSLVKASKIVSSQDWKLEQRHILEISGTLLELRRLYGDKISSLLDSITKEFEETLTKLSGN